MCRKEIAPTVTGRSDSVKGQLRGEGRKNVEMSKKRLPAFPDYAIIAVGGRVGSTTYPT